MTIFKIFKLDMSGTVTVELMEAFDWNAVIINNQHSGTGVLFKIEAVGTTDMVQDNTTGMAHI